MSSDVLGPGRRGGDVRAAGRAEPPARGERALLLADAPFAWLRRVFSALPERYDPLARSGAVANVSLLAAIASGVLLLFWYSPSVHQAHASVAAMDGLWLARLVRSLHRYSSDAAILFAALHGVQLLAARRFGGARWLAWVTGLASLGLLWFVGWLGYWLVWDERGQLVALGTARVIDAIPLISDPLGRSFLTDGSVNSLLFFVVFFLHMLIPLAMGAALWLHVARLARPRYLTSWPLALATLAALALLSVALPADTAAPARMLRLPEDLAIDAWYLLPLALTDRLGGGALWALLLGVGVPALAAPWWLACGRAAPAALDTAKCNGCTLCAKDCPYDAIAMVPRRDGRAYALQAELDADRCVGCGVCAGSCDPGGIGLPWLPVVDARRRIDAWIEEAAGDAHLAFACASSAGAALPLDPAGSSPELPGHRVLAVPCAGWVHPLTIERALRRGARSVLVAGCAGGACDYREGADWEEARLEGRRLPTLRAGKIDAARVRFVRGASRAAIVEAAERLRAGGPAPREARSRAGTLAAAAGVGGLVLLVGAGSVAPYGGPPLDGAALAISFKHAGARAESCRPATEEELAALPVHMRRPEICDRGRAPVRLRVKVDGEVVLERAYEPRGFSGDGASAGHEELPLRPGRHLVEVAIGDTSDPHAFRHRTERRVDVPPRGRVVVLFERNARFEWHAAGPEGEPGAAHAAAAGGT